jgi:hypothetical protein
MALGILDYKYYKYYFMPNSLRSHFFISIIVIINSSIKVFKKKTGDYLVYRFLLEKIL